MAILHGVNLIAENDRVIANDKANGTFEPQSVAAWRGALKPGAVAIDVGAYSGLYAILAAKAGALAVAYECNPLVLPRLLENIAANNVQVEVRKVAASDRHGNAAFYIKADTPLTSAGSMKARENAREVRVATSPVIESRPVCAIKIDVEGAELSVLRGALPILERDRPLVIAEALTDATRRALVMFMTLRGYHWERADKRNLIFRAGNQ